MNTNQIREGITAMKERFEHSGGLSSSDELFITQHYEAVTGKYFVSRGCSSCFKDAFIEMYITINKKDFAMKEENRKYIPLRGKVIFYKGQAYTRPTMTDEIAEDYLKEFPDNIGFFEPVKEDKKEDRKTKDTEAKKDKKEDKK